MRKMKPWSVVFAALALSALFGAVTLAKLDTPTDLDRLTMRQLAWLQTQTRAASQDYGRYIDDYFATGREVEPLRRAMTRAGKLDPPADWQPPQWLKAATSKGAAASK